MRHPVQIMKSRTLLASATLGLLALSGCDQMDPMTRAYVWNPSGTNPHNIAAMAVNPADLIHGREGGPHRASMDTDAVDRVWSNKPTPLLSTTTGSNSGATGGSGGSGGGSSSGGS